MSCAKVNYTHHESSYMITPPRMGLIGDSGPASFELSDSREGGASTWRIGLLGLISRRVLGWKERMLSLGQSGQAALTRPM